MRMLVGSLVLLVISSCAANVPKHFSVLEIEAPVYENVEEIRFQNQTNIETDIFSSYELAATAFPPKGHTWVCGGYAPGWDFAEMFENSKMVLYFIGSYEKWIPIEGTPKKYYVFQVR